MSDSVRPPARVPSHTSDVILDRIIEQRIRMAHTLRCLLQGHLGDPCQFCGLPWQEADQLPGRVIPHG